MLSSPIVRFVLVLSLVGGGAAALYLAAFKPKEDARTDSDRPGFKDMASEAGLHFRMAFLPKEQGEKFKINLYDHGCGVAVADFDNDGLEDIYFVNQLGPNALYKNNGDGTFTDVTQKAGVGLGDRICVGAAWADFDNDGLPDLYVTSTRGGNVLFRNLGNGQFEDVTKKAGLTLIRHAQTPVFFDYDNDGYLDLFVTCTAQWTTTFDQVDKYYSGPTLLTDMVKSEIEFNVLYRNNGDGTFTDVTEQVGLRGKGWGGDVAVFDFDEDGRLDLLVTNMFGRSQLYRNLPNGTFQEVTKETLGRTSWGAIGSKAFDFNNDGKLDLLIVDMHSDMWTPTPITEELIEYFIANEQVRHDFLTGPTATKDLVNGQRKEKLIADLYKLKYDEVLFGNTFFKNLGQGKFTEVGIQAGLETFWPWGIATGDFNNDGYEDVFLPSGMGYPYCYWPNRLLMNQGDETFRERSVREGIEPPRKGRFHEEKIGGTSAARSSRCAAVADFRNLGRLDIVTNNFNDHPYFFQNQFPMRPFVQFRLQGAKTDRASTGSNRDAIGALVYLHLGKEVMVRQVNPAGGYLSQSSQRLHFGLGDRAKIDKAVIHWPSGRRQEIIAPALNQLHKISEPGQ